MIPDFDGFDNLIGRGLARVYGHLREIDRRRKVRQPKVRAPIPTLSVGNITVGGTGKTPMVGYVAAALAARGRTPAVLMRGYLASEPGPIRVPTDGSAARFGDEAVMLARRGLRVWIARRREAGVEVAASGADVLLLDDGFQRIEVARDLDIVMFGSQGLGNGRLLPAGILRDPPSALAAADMFCGDPAGMPALFADTPRFGFRNRGLRWAPGPPENGARVAAVAAIARPQRFFDALDAAGVRLSERHGLADHDPLAAPTLDRLARRFADAGIDTVVVTEKDAVKLDSFIGPARVLVARADYGPVDTATEDAFWRLIRARVHV